MEKPENLSSTTQQSTPSPATSVSAAVAPATSVSENEQQQQQQLQQQQAIIVFEPMNPKLKDSLAFDNACSDVSPNSHTLFPRILFQTLEL